MERDPFFPPERALIVQRGDPPGDGAKNRRAFRVFFWEGGGGAFGVSVPLHGGGGPQGGEKGGGETGGGRGAGGGRFFWGGFIFGVPQCFKSHSLSFFAAVPNGPSW